MTCSQTLVTIHFKIWLTDDGCNSIVSSVRSSNSHPDLLVIQQHPTFSDHTYPLHISRPHCDINWDHFASCGGYKDNTFITLETTWRSRRPLLSAHHRPDIHYWVNSQCIGQGGQSGADLKFSWPHCNRAGPSQPLIPQCIFFHRMHLHSDQLYWIFLWFRSWSKHFWMALLWFLLRSWRSQFVLIHHSYKLGSSCVLSYL